MYPHYTSKLLRDWYRKKDEILKSHNKHKRFKLDNPKANGEYQEIEEELAQYISTVLSVKNLSYERDSNF